MCNIPGHADMVDLTSTASVVNYFHSIPRTDNAIKKNKTAYKKITEVHK